MILPVTAYGDPLLRKVSQAIDKDYPGLPELIQNMYETMHNANGVGLAAPQVGFSLRLIVVDAAPLAGEKGNEYLKDFRKTFINPQIKEEKGKEWSYNEGCLSLPEVREDIVRKSEILIEYYDENFNFFSEHYEGVKARIILHEYDHLEGILLIDRLSPLRKRLLKSRLTNISKGNIKVNYKMLFPSKKVKNQFV